MPIEHFFVLMLENRSFDHIFGFSQINGKDATTGDDRSINIPDPAVNANADLTGKVYPVHNGADFSLKDIDKDPGHEFENVQEQLAGPNLGFVKSYQEMGAANPGRVMDCFSPSQLPVLNQLAAEFAICDNWFSSLPGPTWPNRFFMMAATSGGLTKSPSTGDIIRATAFKGYRFQNGNIFDALDKKNIPWCIIEGDLFPVSFALKGMNKNSADGRFVDFGKFAEKLADPGFKEQFIFIEPQYGSHKFDVTGPGDFSGGNSMHPLDDVRKGEQLVKDVYETIRSIPAVWEKSVLLITFDEHGGFYDHVPPGATAAPGDQPINAAGGQLPFAFDSLGVRVPAIIISPLIEKNIIDHTIYDHSSALATMERIFNVSPLTNRDKEAKDFIHLFSLETARTDTPQTLNNPATTATTTFALLAPEKEDSRESLKKELATLETPSTSELKMNQKELTGPQVGFAYVGLMRSLGKAKTQKEKTAWKKEFAEMTSRRDAARFMARAKLKVYFDEYVPRK